MSLKDAISTPRNGLLRALAQSNNCERRWLDYRVTFRVDGDDIVVAESRMVTMEELPGAAHSGRPDVTEDQIRHMVDRFLGWRLPEDFNPDDGISFKRTFNDHLYPPSRHEPTGTNLFSAEQATAMVRYMIDGLPKSA